MISESVLTQLSAELRHLEGLNTPTQIHTERYKEILRYFQKEGVDVIPGNRILPLPKGLSSMDKKLAEVFGQIGSANPFSISQGVECPPADVVIETVEWHKAAIEVFEYMSAQMSLDLFKSNPKAKQIWERIIMSGYRQLHNEATGAYRQ